MRTVDPLGVSAARAGWLLATVLTLTIVLSACGRRSDAPSEDSGRTPSVEVRVGTISERLFRPMISASGQWISSNDLVMSAPFAAIVDSVIPRPGDRVSRREVLAWLTTRESEAALEGAELLLLQAADATARAEAERALALARRDIVRVPLTAQAAGIVVRRTVGPGAMVEQGAEILAIVPDGALVFEAHIPLSEANQVRVGQPARVENDGGTVVGASVRRFLPSTSAADQSALAWLSPAGSVPLGLPGRFGTAFIETGAPRRGLGVPDSALVEDDLTGEVRVARVDSLGLAIWTTLKVGIEQDGWRELIAPSLRPGSLVVVRGQHGLPDSTRVRARP
jgi:multidrug efflux pump subunit AcrA (membrane-fusion protein)